MRCPGCGTDVAVGQKFCMECGASLRGVADVTGEVPVVSGAQRVTDEPTQPLRRVPPPPAPDRDVTAPLVVVEATDAPVVDTGEMRYAPAPAAPHEPAGPEPARQGFRLRPLLLLTVLAAGATVAGVLTQVVEIDPALDAGAPGYMINDFGTNNTVAALLAAGLMVVGGLVWCAGHHWGAGLAGGAGASLAGWVALVLGVAEWQLADGDAAGSAVGRSPGFWILSAAGALGVLVLLASIARAGRLRRAGLDPWVAALAAMSFIIAAGGPLIPPDRADWSVNWSSESLPVELPTAFFAGRAVQLGLLAVCGVVGCLLVRRWGLGLAVGGALSSGWLLVTAATDRTDKPIGPAYANPGYTTLEPHAVTVVGFSLVGFFCLVAIVMALLDAGR